MKKISKPRQAILLLITLLFAIILVIGVSFAYLSAQGVSGNDDTNRVLTTVAKYGNLTVSYDGTDGSISLGAVDLPYSTKGTNITRIMKFNVTADSTQTVQTKYSIDWTRVSNSICQYASGSTCTNVNSNTYVGDELQYALYRCGTAALYNSATAVNVATNCTTVLKSSTAVPTTATTITAGQTITASTTNYYVLLLTLKNLNTAQDYQAGGAFSGALKVTPATN